MLKPRTRTETQTCLSDKGWVIAINQSPEIQISIKKVVINSRVKIDKHTKKEFTIVTAGSKKKIYIMQNSICT